MTDPAHPDTAGLLDSVREAFQAAIHDRCGEAWIETEVAVERLLASGWSRAPELDEERLTKAVEHPDVLSGPITMKELAKRIAKAYREAG